MIAPWRSAGCAAFLILLTTFAPDPVAEFAGALGSVPGVAPRLSIPVSFRPCSERTPENGTVPRAECPASGAPGTGRLTRLAAKVGDVEDGAVAARALAAMDLVLDDGRGIRLDRAISSLRDQVAVAERPAPVLADLAAALIVRAERTQSPRDLLEAYQTAEDALRHEPRNLAALYNRALALDRFGLVDEAARDWDAYLAADSRSGWADEARRRRQALAALAPPARPPADAPLNEYARYAAVEPQGARELGMNKLLAEWGAAVEAGDAARAADRLRRAGALGDALERRPGGDASLADAVRAIRTASGNAAAIRDLATAHREYAAGVAVLEKGDGDIARAGAHFTLAESASGASHALLGWTRIYRGILRVMSGKGGEGERVLRGVAAADPVRYPAMAARALWSLGNTLNRAERWEEGLEQARQSTRLFTLAGESENEGAALMIVADASFVLGEPDSGYIAARQLLGRLRPYRNSLRLHTQLVAIARFAAADGLLGSAIRIQDEGVRVAIRSARPSLVAEARLSRARLLADAGDLRAVQAEVEVTRPLLQRIEAPYGRAWLQADLYEADAAATLHQEPNRATLGFDSAAAFFGRAGIPFRVLPSLVRGAEARLLERDPVGAAERLQATIQLLDRRRDSIRIEPRRAAVFDAARTVVDRLVMLKIAEGRVAEALDYMDRARASLAAAGPVGMGDAAGGLRVPAGEVAVEYARIADTLLIWTMAGTRTEVFRTAVDTVWLARTVSELERALERGSPEAEVRPRLSELYERLVRPVAARLGDAGTPLVVIADGEIASVPFAALRDAQRGRYLVEDHPLRFAVSLREAFHEPTRDVASGALFVADPAFDPGEHRLLDRLKQAREEVRVISGEYSRPVVLEADGATWPAVQTELTRVGVVHFAGHAVFDDARPERSYLVLAPTVGRGGSGKVTAAELAELDLRHVRLVVLAACRTVRSRQSRAGGFSGLSGALLAAGVRGTVGSTWDVDDRSTAALMAEFHRAYRGSSDGPTALRAAQLALLRSTHPELRATAAWAGFRYVGL